MAYIVQNGTSGCNSNQGNFPDLAACTSANACLPSVSAPSCSPITSGNYTQCCAGVGLAHPSYQACCATAGQLGYGVGPNCLAYTSSAGNCSQIDGLNFNSCCGTGQPSDNSVALRCCAAAGPVNSLSYCSSSSSSSMQTWCCTSTLPTCSLVTGTSSFCIDARRFSDSTQCINSNCATSVSSASSASSAGWCCVKPSNTCVVIPPTSAPSAGCSVNGQGCIGSDMCCSGNCNSSGVCAGPGS